MTQTKLVNFNTAASIRIKLHYLAKEKPEVDCCAVRIKDS